MSVLFTSVPAKRLAVSVTASATSLVLSDILDWAGASLTAADFGTVGYGVLRNSTNTALEFFSWDPSTIAVGATTGITLLKRGLDFTGDLTTETTAYKLTWVRGDTIVELGSNPSQLYQYLKEYIDGVALSGAPNASTTTKGIVEEATQAEVDAGTTAGATAARLFVNPSTIRAGNYNDYVADTGAADAYVIAPSPAITAYAAGQIFTFKAANANTGASTVNVSALGTKSIKKNVSLALAAGDIAASAIVTVVYDGTNFQLLAPTPSPITPVVRTYLNAASPATWTKPAGLKYVVVQVQAAGANGGTGTSGAGGGFSMKLIAAASLGATETVTIGAGGAPGGDSSFGSHATATGGNGTTGGSAADGDVNIRGQDGQDGQTVSHSSSSSTNYFGGDGGDSFLGHGGPGTRNSGTPGSYGGGGGGSGYGSGGGGSSGAGANGIVIVTEYYS